jgi:hypothetical protein
MTQLSTQTTDLTGLDAGPTQGGLSVARTLPPIAMSAAGPALSNSIAPTSLLLAAAKAVLPGGFFTVGKALRLIATGIISNIVTTPGTLTLDVRFGSTVVFNGGAVNLNAAAKTNVSFRLDLLLTCRAVGSGSAANLFGVGVLTSESVVGAAAGTALPAALPASAPAVGNGFDSTAAQTVDLFGTFSIANAGNAIQVLEYSLDSVTS